MHHANLLSYLLYQFCGLQRKAEALMSGVLQRICENRYFSHSRIFQVISNWARVRRIGNELTHALPLYLYQIITSEGKELKYHVHICKIIHTRASENCFNANLINSILLDYCKGAAYYLAELYIYNSANVVILYFSQTIVFQWTRILLINRSRWETVSSRLSIVAAALVPENNARKWNITTEKKYRQLRRKMCSKLNGAIKLSGREAFYRFSVASLPLFFFNSLAPLTWNYISITHDRI